MSVLGLNSGCTVKYNPWPLGTPSDKELYLTVYPLSCPNTDAVTAVTANVDAAVPLELIASFEK